MPARLLILGLDGLDPSLLKQFFAKHRCQNLAKLQAQSSYSTFLPAFPAVSPALWTSYFTGKLPLEHGLIDLLYRQDYQLCPCTANQRQMATIFQQLAQQGLKVAALGFPGSYPAEKGPTVISGFDAPWAGQAGSGAFSSPGLQKEIIKLGSWQYGTVNEFLAIGQSLPMAKTLVKALQRDLDHKEKVITSLLRRENWDLFAFHLQTADTAGHHLWHLDDIASPLHPPKIQATTYQEQIYESLDNFVGHIINETGPDTKIMLLSDHGMGGSNGVVVHLNILLQQAGLLAFKKQTINPLSFASSILSKLPDIVRRLGYRFPLPPKLLNRISGHAMAPAIDFNKTKVWAQEIDASPALFVNLAGRDPNGMVTEDELPALTAKITDLLTGQKDPQSGQPIFRALLPANQLADTVVPWAADFYPIYNWLPTGYRCSVSPSIPGRQAIEIHSQAAGKGLGMPGVHRQGGIFWLKSPISPVGPCAPQQVTAVYGLIAKLLELDLPNSPADSHSENLSPQEKELIINQLIKLGYIG